MISDVCANNKVAVEKELIKVAPSHVMSFIGRTHEHMKTRNTLQLIIWNRKGK